MISPASRTKVKMAAAAKYVRVLSERVMIRQLEGPVARLMDEVQHRVMQQPGLMQYETLQDTKSPNNYLVLTKWESREHLARWLRDPDYQRIVAKMDKVLQAPATYKVLEKPEGTMFLL